MHEFDRRFWRTHLLWPLLAFVAVATPFEFTDLDLLLTDPFYDKAAQRWTYQRSFWTVEVLHRWGKHAVFALGAVPLLMLLASRWRRPLVPYRQICLYLLAGIAGSPGLVALLKVLTARHCPWGIDRYGGKVPWTRLFEAVPVVPGVSPGLCFPAAHAATGFGLVCLYFAARALPNARPRRWLWFGLVTGTVFGIGQHVRGAHFASHTVWSCAVAWFFTLGAYRAFGGRARLAPDLNAAGTAR
ncbi:MAG: phosphatase PAP2 family protein [Planctomycetota bacterium]